MNHPFNELYKGHLLRCAPRATSDGRYAARLRVSVAGDDQDVYVYDPPTPSRESDREAADDALVAGRSHVDRRMEAVAATADPHEETRSSR